MKRAVAIVALAGALAPSSVALADDASAPSSPSAPPIVEDYPPVLSTRALTPPDGSYTFQGPRYYPSVAWFLTQLVPSPEVGAGSVRRVDMFGVGQRNLEVAFGLRWHVTPVLWSWGTNRHVSRWRFLVVDPLARHAGSIELDGTFEYLFGHVDRMLVRPGVRAYLPLLARGEYLSTSVGVSTYSYDGVPRVAYDVGLYALFGLVGAQVTVAPAHAPLTTIATLRLRYF